MGNNPNRVIPVINPHGDYKDGRLVDDPHGFATQGPIRPHDYSETPSNAQDGQKLPGGGTGTSPAE